MRSMKKYSRSGFTLVELIIVVGLFSIIMYSVVALMDPLSKYFVRSSNFESTTACMDNIKRGIEGNLKYADRVRVYKDFAPYVYDQPSDSNGAKVSTYAPTDDLKTKVQLFYDYFFKDRKYLCSHGSIYVLCFDNTEIMSNADLSVMNGLLHDYTDNRYNTGKLVLYEYKFNNYDTTPFTGTPVSTQVWYVNQNLYGNYDYSFQLGAFDAEEETTTADPGAAVPVVPGAGPDETPATFNPQDCTIGIQIREIMKDSSSASGLIRSDNLESASSSFSMKNVLDATNHYNTPLADYILIDNPNLPALDPSNPDSALQRLEEKYVTLKNDHGLPMKRYRYASLNENHGTVDKDLFDGFYFIFTVPEKIYDDTDKDPEYTNFIHNGHSIT